MNTFAKSLVFIAIGVGLNGCLIDDNDSNKTSAPDPVEPPVVELPTVNSLKDLAGDYPVGVAVPAGSATNSIFNSDDKQTIIVKQFNQLTAENIMKPESLQPTQGDYTFDDADDLIAFAQTKGMSVHGHTLVWHQQIPEWMTTSCEASATDCEAILEDHVTVVAQHFAGNLTSWDVVNEAFDDNGEYRNEGEDGSIWYQALGESYIGKAFTTARNADATAELYYNDYNLSLNGAKLDSTISMVEGLKDSNVPIDGIGFQMHITSTSPTIEEIKGAFTKAVDTGLKVKITELDVRMNADGSYTDFTDDLAEQQKDRYEEVVSTYLTVVPEAQRGGISVWGLSDDDSWIIDLYGNPDWPLLFDENLNQKPAINGFSDGLKSDPESPVEPEIPSDDTLFQDDFSNGVSWYLKDSSTVSGTFEANSTDQTMDVNIDWKGTTDNFDIAVVMETPIDITNGVSLSFKIKIPKAYVDDNQIAIQPFFEDVNYAPAYIGYQVVFNADNWVTFTIENIDPNFGFGYIAPDFDYSQVSNIGFQFIANGKSADVTGIIQVDDVIIY